MHAFAGHPAVRPFEMRPDVVFLRPHRAEIDVAGFRGDGRVPAFDFDEPGDAETRPRPQDHLRAAAPEGERADRARPVLRNGRQHQGLRLEVVEQESLREAGAARRLGPVHHPGRVGELERPPCHRPRAAGDHRARPLAKLRRRRLERLGQARIIVGDEVDSGSQRPARLLDQREPDVGAAGVADKNRKGKGDVAHGWA